MEILHCNAQAAFLGGRRVSSGDRGPCRLHAHSTAHCGAASLAFIGPNHACRSHRESLSPQQQHPREDGGAVGLYGWSGGLVAEAPAVDDLQQVEDIDHAVGVGIALARRCAVVA